jgi:hypothetical protein
MYIAIECKKVCAYNLSAEVISSRPSNVSEPLYLYEAAEYKDVVYKGKPKYYFYPFNKTKGDMIFALDRLNNTDAYIIGRLLT